MLISLIKTFYVEHFLVAQGCSCDQVTQLLLSMEKLKLKLTSN